MFPLGSTVNPRGLEMPAIVLVIILLGPNSLTELPVRSVTSNSSAAAKEAQNVTEPMQKQFGRGNRVCTTVHNQHLARAVRQGFRPFSQ